MAVVVLISQEQVSAAKKKTAVGRKGDRSGFSGGKCFSKRTIEAGLGSELTQSGMIGVGPRQPADAMFSTQSQSEAKQRSRD